MGWASSSTLGHMVWLLTFFPNRELFPRGEFRWLRDHMHGAVPAAGQGWARLLPAGVERRVDLGRAVVLASIGWQPVVDW